MLTVRDIGEQGLLQKLQSFCPPEVIGDDGAVLTFPAQQLVITTDLLIDGVHFSVGLAKPEIRTTSPADAGWRSAAANLSDLAAMGATPKGITVGLGLPGDLPIAWVEELYQGMTDCLGQSATPIVGGDIVRSPVLTLAITAFGQAHPDRIIRRTLARPGDAIVVTGPHGNSRAGLELLLKPEFGPCLPELDRAYLIQAHQRPRPRLDVLPILWDRLQVDRVAGMDSSDGLADAIIQICRMSGVGAEIDRSRLPIAPALHHLVDRQQAWNWCLYGGEDFELVLCLPQKNAQMLVQHLGKEAAIIGRITTGPEVLLIDHSLEWQEVLDLNKGFQHF